MKRERSAAAAAGTTTGALTAESEAKSLLEVRETADSMTATSQSLKDLIGSPDLETTIARLDRSLQDATAGADQTMNRAIDRMTWRLVLLLVIAFLLGVALVLVAGWQKKRLAAQE